MPTVTLNGAEDFYRDEGSGTDAVLGHSSSATSGQWRRFMERMGDRFRLLAPDLHGYGRTDAFAADGSLFEAEVSVFEALMDMCDGPVHLVGQSYGGAIAAHAALRRPEQVPSLTVIEPTLFHLLAEGGEAEADKEIRGVAERVNRHVDRGEAEEAARGFIGYWVGPGAFDAMEPGVRAAVAASMPKLYREWTDCFEEGQPMVADFATLAMPTLLVRGTVTTLAARRVVDILRRLLPGPDLAEIEGAGHISPLTHPDLVDSVIEAHLTRHAPTAGG